MATAGGSVPEASRDRAIVLVAESGDGAIVGYLYGTLEDMSWEDVRAGRAATSTTCGWTTTRAAVALRPRSSRAPATGSGSAARPGRGRMTASRNASAHELFRKLGFRDTMIEMTRASCPRPDWRGAPPHDCPGRSPGVTVPHIAIEPHHEHPRPGRARHARDGLGDQRRQDQPLPAEHQEERRGGSEVERPLQRWRELSHTEARSEAPAIANATCQPVAAAERRAPAASSRPTSSGGSTSHVFSGIAVALTPQLTWWSISVRDPTRAAAS